MQAKTRVRTYTYIQTSVSVNRALTIAISGKRPYGGCAEVNGPLPEASHAIKGLQAVVGTHNQPHRVFNG